MMLVLVVVIYAAKVKAKLENKSAESRPDPMMIEMPTKLINAVRTEKKMGDPSDAENKGPRSLPLYESDAPPPPSDPVKTSKPVPQWPAPKLYSDYTPGDLDELLHPVHLQVLSWEPMPGSMPELPLTPRAMGAMDPHTPREGSYDGAETPRMQGVITVTASLEEAMRGDAQWLCAPHLSKLPGASQARS
jgi:hypothetical protein